MIHNSFDIVQEDKRFKAISHNFPEFHGYGMSESEAIDSMDRRIIHYADNNFKSYQKRLLARMEKGLECECGHKLDGQALTFYRGIKK